MEIREKIRIEEELTTIFTPATPVRTDDVFAGRLDQIIRVLSAINQRGQHAIIYGERGVGKTSLANVLIYAKFIHKVAVPVTKVTADSKSSFFSLWNDVFQRVEMPHDVAQRVSEAGADTENTVGNPRRNRTYADSITENPSPGDVVDVLRTFPESVIMIDEFDRIHDDDVTSSFADLIKQLSDNDINITLILIGVADNISELIAEHASIERCTKQVYLPRMSQDELEEIIRKGFKKIHMKYERATPGAIARLSQGFPHYTHQLGLYAGLEALRRDRMEIRVSDVQVAIENAIADALATTQSAYVQSIRSTKKENLYERVLIACAIANQDELGYFAPVDVKKPLCLMVGNEHRSPNFGPHLAKFCGKERGKILERIEIGSSHRCRYRFRNPLMRPYVFLRGVSSGLVPKGYSPF